MFATAAAIAVAAGALLVSTASAEPPGNPGRAQDITVISRATSINRLALSNPPQTGDRWTFRDDLFSSTTLGTKIGRADGECVLIDPVEFRFECTITNSLPDGDLMTHGSLTAVQGSTSTGAIIGGTRAYTTARGEATITLGPLGGPHEATFSVTSRP
ncbi:hypothetical protein PHK61_30415 [Actinomycetospora lutea]|uniref:hypothetical protein n=1 Tax=Actinomycetospora lutea TaxID=663604 RepID=UPI0023651F09|nr:hypothetical protein [Actinomycetospora lutea]MDD7942737.1 hypothetical protein [Actinomycetospora lutea]